MSASLLVCGHFPADRERLRPGTEKWCSTCCCWREQRGRPRIKANDVAEAAVEYVAARRANEAASPDAWSIALSRVDAAWCRLLELVDE